MPFEIVLQGVDLLLRQMADYENLRDQEYRQASAEGLRYLRSPLREYPPERPGQRYVRTGRLAEGWASAEPSYTPTPSGFSATMENPTSYGPYVQGGQDDDPHQAWMHAGHWTTDDEIVHDDEPQIIQYFNEATDRLAKRLAP